MKKRLLSALLALTVLLGSMPVYALEDTTPATPDPAEVSTTETGAADNENSLSVQELESKVFSANLSDAEIPDGEELFALYMQEQMYPGYQISTLANWGEESGVLNESGLFLYHTLKDFAGKMAKGEVASTENYQIPLPMSATYSELGVSGSTDPGLSDALGMKFNAEAQVFEVLDFLPVDCPAELYWFDKTKSVSWNFYGAKYISGGVAVEGIEISIPIAEAYCTDSIYSANQDKIKGAFSSIENAKAIADKYADLPSDYEKMVAFRDEISALTDYNRQAADVDDTPYGDPWQIIYVFDGDPNTTVVCEGYSKAFQYLCDLSGIPCYTVTGTMYSDGSSGLHMWNVVPLDGQNYLVDVTNYDRPSPYPMVDALFLGGASGSVTQKYTVTLTAPYYGTFDYEYDKETIQLYGEDILKLASSKYTPPALELAIAGMPETVTYGDTFTLTAENTDEAAAWSATGAAQVESSTGLVTVTGVGDFTITATTGDQSASVTGKAVPKALNVTGAAAQDKIYDGTADVEVTDVILGGILPADAVSVDLSKVIGTVSSANAGIYETISLQNLALTGDKADCYTLAATADDVQAEVKIEKATPAAPEGSYTATYGQKLADIDLPEGWNWAEPETELSQLGDHTYQAKYAETTNYTAATATLKVTVTARTVEPTVTVSDNLTFTGSAIQPEVTVQVDGVTLTEGTHYTVSYSDNTNAGTATVTVQAIEESGYAFEDVVKNFTIEKAPAPEATTQAVSHRYTVTGQQQATVQNPMPFDAGIVTYSKGTETDEKGIVGTWSVQDGTVVYTLSGEGAAGDTATLPVIIRSQNYEDATVNLVITLTDLDVPVVTVQPYTKTYDGKPVDINDITKNSGSIEGTWRWKDGTAEPVNVADSNTYQLVFTPTDTANYASVEVSVSVMITKAASGVSQDPAAVSGLTYSGEAQPLITAGIANGGTMLYALNSEGPFKTELPTATNAGTYTVWYMVRGDANHENLQPQELGTVTIAKADPTPEIPANLTATYGDTLADVHLPEGWTWVDSSATSVGDAGEQTFSATYDETDNYNAYTQVLTVKVNPKDLSGATVQTDQTQFVYNGSVQKPTVTEVTLDNAALSADDYTISGEETADAGDYQLTVTGKGNYTGSFTVSYSIAKKQVMATVTAQDKVYDGTTNAVLTASVPGENLTITGLKGTFAQKNVGENLTITVDATNAVWSNANYTVAFPETATASIVGAAYTYAGVANQEVRIGNGLDTVNTNAVATGIPGEQVEGALTWYEDSAHSHVLDDSYLFQGTDGATVTLYWTFTPGESAANYDRTPATGSTEFTLTEKLIPQLQVESLSKTYDGKDVVLDDLKKNADVAGTWSFVEDTPELKDADTYTVTVRFTPENTNDYTVATCSVTVTIEPKPVIVSMILPGGNRIKTGENLPQPELTYSGVLESESLTPSVEPVFEGMPAASEAGTYMVRWTNAKEMQAAIEALPAAKNYLVATQCTQVELVVLKGDVTVQPEIQEEEDKTYRVEAATGMEESEIPQSLQDEGYDNEGKIQEKMYKTASEVMTGLSMENTVLYDVNLYYRTGEDEPWVEVTEETFPEQGITVTLPYPDGTNATDFDFVVTHMLTVKDKAGQVETPAVTKTDKGIRFTVYSLSPIAISWKAVSKPAITEESSSGNSSDSLNSSGSSAAATPAPSGSSISYYTCPACGYHDWTATDEGYRCDECGYLESVKQLSGYGNVKGTYEPKSSGATAAAAETIPQTGDESKPVLWAVLMFASVLTLGGLLISRRKRSR